MDHLDHLFQGQMAADLSQESAQDQNLFLHIWDRRDHTLHCRTKEESWGNDLLHCSQDQRLHSYSKVDLKIPNVLVLQASRTSHLQDHILFHARASSWIPDHSPPA